MTRSDEELRRRFRRLEEALQPQVRPPGPAAAAGRARRRRRTLLAVTAMLLLGGIAAVGTLGMPAERDQRPAAPSSSSAPGPAPTTVPTSTEPPTTRPPASSSPATATTVPGRMILTAGGLGGLVSFGDTKDQALRAMRGRFGPPDQELRWDQAKQQHFGACPGSGHSFARWGAVYLLFAESGTRYGRPGGARLFAVYVDGHEGGRPDAATAAGIGLGSTVAELRAAYGARARIGDGPPSPWFTVDPGISGSLSSTRPAGRVLLLVAGEACGE